MPGKKTQLPDTLKRSPEKAGRTWREAHDSALSQYHDEERASRTAYAALKRAYEKVGDRWEPKKRRGPSDPQSKQHGPAARDRPRKTYGGVDVEGNTRDELYRRARDMGIRGASRMRKTELAEALAKRG